jgi:hypothetical protein
MTPATDASGDEPARDPDEEAEERERRPPPPPAKK